MTTASIPETDVRIRDAVMKQLDWNPEVDASAVGVSHHSPHQPRENGAIDHAAVRAATATHSCSRPATTR